MLRTPATKARNTPYICRTKLIWIAIHLKVSRHMVTYILTPNNLLVMIWILWLVSFDQMNAKAAMHRIQVTIYYPSSE